MILASMGAMFEKSLKFSALLATILLASCGGGGGSATSTSTITEDVITWTNGIYDSWQLTSENITTSDLLCTVDVYSRDTWLEKNINGVPTGIKGALIRTETENRNEQCPITETSSSSSTKTTTLSVDSGPVTTTTNTIEDRASTDANGSTVIKTYTIYTDTSTVTTTTTSTSITTIITNYSDGASKSVDEDPIITTSSSDAVSSVTREVLTNTVVTANVVSASDSDSVSTSTSTGTTVLTTTSATEDRISTDANGSTVVKTYTIYTDVTTTPVTTTVTVTTTKTNVWTDGISTSEIVDTVVTNSTTNTVTIATREELINIVVIANIVSTTNGDSTSTTSTDGTPVTITSSTTEDRISTDVNGSTVVKTYTIYTDTTTTPNAIITIVTTIQTTLWTDGTTTNKIINTTQSVTNDDVISIITREELTNTGVTANVASTSDSDSTATSSSNGSPVVITTSVNDTRVSADTNGNTISKVYKVYTDVSTVTSTTVTAVITTRTTLWTDGTSTSEVIDTATSSANTDTVTSSTREELISTTVTANVSSTSDNDNTTTTTSNGTPTTVTSSTTEDRASTDINDSMVIKTYVVYTDTITTPITTTNITTTTRTTLWTDGTSTSEVIDTVVTNSTSNTTTSSIREKLTNTVVTPNIVSTSTVYLNEKNLGTVKSDLISELYGTNSDTITVGTDENGNPIQQSVTLYYYAWYKNVHDKIAKDQHTRTTYTDGSVVDTLVQANVDFSTTPVKEYLLDPWGGKKTTTQRVPVGETFIGNPVAPDGSSGSSGVYTYAQRDANHNTTNYDATTYYNDTALGTPTAGVNNNPSSYETTEAENGAVLVTYANHAYSRGWTGKGSTALIMDTGIDQDHPEFTGKVKYLWDAGYATPYEDENGHGSHVAGIVSANKDSTGIHGIAYDADLAIAKIGEANGISLSGAKQALNWAKQYDDIVVANLSVNTNYSSSYTSSMTDQGNGIFTNDHAVYGGANYYNLEDVSTWKSVIPDELVLVVSAGNTNLGYVQNPATLASAVDSNGNLELDGRMLVAGNWNTSTQTIDGAKSGHVCKNYTTQCNDTYKTSDFYLLAPGTNINSVKNGGGYVRMSGTSMAAPVITAGVSIVYQMWPYMEGSNIAQVLLQTADKNLSNYSVNTHGQGLLDLDRATQPVGGLGISLTGRTGTTASISGGLSISGVDDSVIASLSSVSAIDDFDRDFKVDLTPLVNQTDNSMPLQSVYTKGDSWGVRLSNLDVKSIDDFRIGLKNKKHFLVGYNKPIADTALDLNLSYSKNKTNPWVDVSGVWGSVDSANTIDGNLTWNNGNFWVQGGAMVTNTDLTDGLVVDIDNLYSIYTTAGWEEDSWRIYAGTKPKLVKADIEFNLPSNVDSSGVMHYSKQKTQIKNDIASFVGGSWQQDISGYSLITNGVIDSSDKHYTSIAINKKF